MLPRDLELVAEDGRRAKAHMLEAKLRWLSRYEEVQRPGCRCSTWCRKGTWA